MKILNHTRRGKKLFHLALLLILAAGTLHHFTKPKANNSIEIAQQMAPEIPVVKITKTDITKTLTFPAKTFASKTSEIRPQIGGVITKIMFTEGSFVKKGTKLYEIDPAERITILAPISGYISRSFITEGALVTPSQATVLATITQLDPIYVDIAIPSSYLLEIKQQNPKVQLILNGQKYPYQGAIKFFEVFVNQMTDSFTLRSQFQNPKGELLAGAYVDVQLILNKGKGILVPQRSVNVAPDSSLFVFVIQKDGTVTQKVVSVNGTAGQHWIIKNGLAEGDLVVYEGFQKIQAGMKVQPKVIEV